ncbi:hypothetical protein Hanom_Chr17g01570661 [Helianthus anomalus]
MSSTSHEPQLIFIKKKKICCLLGKKIKSSVKKSSWEQFLCEKIVVGKILAYI